MERLRQMPILGRGVALVLAVAPAGLAARPGSGVVPRTPARTRRMRRWRAARSRISRMWFDDHEGVQADPAADEPGRAGSVTSPQPGRLQRVLAFRALRAADVQVPRPAVVAIPADATCAQLATVACESGLSRFPVVGEDLDDVLGVVVAKDVLAVPNAGDEQ